MKRQRKSNIEVLRILAMFMILLGHAWYHFEKNVGDYPLKEFAYQIINPLLYMHVDIFVMITGFFGLKLSVKKLVNLYLVCVFYTVFALISAFLIPGAEPFRWRTLVFPISQGDWWFIRIYIALMLISPMLNMVVEKCTENKNWNKMLLVVVTLDFYISWFHKIDGLYAMGYDLVNFASVYLLGRYIRLNRLPINLRKSVIILLVLSVIKLGLSQGSIFYPAIEKLLRLNVYCNPLNVVMAMMIVHIFSQWRINWSNKWINSISSSTLVVYLATDNRYMRGVKMFTEWLYAQLGNSYAYLPVYILILCAIFFICILLDKVRFSITKPFVNYIVDKWKLK